MQFILPSMFIDLNLKNDAWVITALLLLLFQDIPGGLTSFGVEEYYPYVYFKINIDMLEDKK